MSILVGQQSTTTDSMISSIIAETAHGLSAGMPVAFDGTGWVKSKANSVTTGASGVVYEVLSADTFTFVSRGYFSLPTTGEWDALAGTTGGLTPGLDYAVSQVSAGLYETTTPTSGIVQFMFRAVSTTEVDVYCAPPRRETAHAAIDHDALWGGGLATVLNPTTAATPTLLQAAVTAFKYVYLEPGAYSYGATNFTLQIPEGHHLIGLSLGDSGTYAGQAYFNLSGPNQYFHLNQGTSIQNIGIFYSITTGSYPTQLIYCPYSSGDRALVKNVYADFNGVATSRFIYAPNSASVRVENCIGYNIPQAGTGPMIQVGGVGNGAQYSAYGGVYETKLYFGGSPTGTKGGIYVLHGDVVSCGVFKSGGHGIYMQGAQNYQPKLIFNNQCYDCGSSTAYHGIYIISGGDTDWISVLQNRAHLCGGYGIYIPSNRITYFSVVISENYSSANGTGTYYNGTAVLTKAGAYYSDNN